MRDIANLRSLQRLVIGGNPITDKGLAHLGQLRKLKYLGLYSLPITDAGLKHLRDLQQLECLVLTKTAIGDPGLRYLGQLPKLKRVRLPNNIWLERTRNGLITSEWESRLGNQGHKATDR